MVRRRPVMSFEDKPPELPSPPKLIANHNKLVRIYRVNHQWKSINAKLAINVYMFIVARMLFVTCVPWYTYFKYLTAWGWTFVQIYFLYTFYLDCVSRWRQQPVSEVARTCAQAISEVAFAVQVVVSLFFWFCVYPQEPWRSIPWEINMHGIGLFLMIFDYLYRFAGFQLRNLRFVYAFASFYTVLHVTTVLASGEPIYPGLDFRNVYSFVIFLAGLTTIVVTHKLFYLLHNWARLRQEWKTVVGISAFFLLPRKDSMEVLLTDDSPARMGSETATTEEGSARTTDPGIGERLRSFAYKEVLSVSPCQEARRSIRQ